MADKAFMAYRALRRHARSCSFVLRAGGISIASREKATVASSRCIGSKIAARFEKFGERGLALVSREKALKAPAQRRGRA